MIKPQYVLHHIPTGTFYKKLSWGGKIALNTSYFRVHLCATIEEARLDDKHTLENMLKGMFMKYKGLIKNDPLIISDFEVREVKYKMVP
jgi:hypothetical protein